MTVVTFEIRDPGLLTTIQDRGRYGYQRYGVPVSGAMDEFALRMANLMAGNDQNAAALEATVQGPRIEFHTSTWIAVTGADMTPEVDGQPVPMWESLEIEEGSVLEFGDLRDGMRAYIAVRGGIDVPVVMGSRSTYLKGCFGGLEGRALKAGDILSTLPTEPDTALSKRLPKDYTAPVYGGTHRLRVVLGPQQHAFDSNALSRFLSSRYRVHSDSDRMGYMLDGPMIEHLEGADIVSDGNPPGAIQIHGDGIPRILLSDRGTTGGYTKIATVISVDLPSLAQALPGQSVSFRQVTVEEAQDALREQESIIRSVARQGQLPKMSISLDDVAFAVETEDGQPITQPMPISGPSEEVLRSIGVNVDGESYDFRLSVERES
ncbi:MAG: biotin-dependent carboxyltransferase [Dehalococcoidia bacterium]|nr:biotin-dependent carboxyltransferase [Dehalococcoidia bacterium]